MKQMWLVLCPLGHPNHTKALGSFAKSLQDRYLAQRDISDLNKTIEMGEKWLELCSPDHPDHATALNNLALSLNSCFQRLHNLEDVTLGPE